MGNLGGDLEKRLVKLGIKKQVEASMVVEEAQKAIEKVFGDRGRENLLVISFSKGTLKIAASNNLWAAECQNSRIEYGDNIKNVRFLVTDISAIDRN